MINLLQKIFDALSDFLDELKLKICICVLNLRKTARNMPKKIEKIVPIGKKHRKKVTMSIVSIYLNEDDLIEWIEYHKLIGVERFYLYDHGSTDNSRELLQPYIDDGTVVYHYIEDEGIQIQTNADAICRYKNETKWMALIDCDEYIVPIKTNDIRELLKDYEKYPALMMNWVPFDSNGIDKRPEGKLAIELFTRVHKNYDDPNRNVHIKSVVNPRKVVVCNHPHFCFYKNDEMAVTTDFRRQYKKERFLQRGIRLDVLQLNHYFTKSREEYIKKLSRGRSDIQSKWNFNEGALNFSEYTYDYKIQKYLPELKKRMGL